MVRDFSKRVLLKIRKIFHKQIHEGIGFYRYATWIFLGLNCEVFLSYLSVNNFFPVEAQFYLKRVLWCVSEKFGNFFKKAICQKNIFQLDMFHNAEAVGTSLKKISIASVFLSYGKPPEGFFNSCFSNCY